jgi:hypothetical protein
VAVTSSKTVVELEEFKLVDWEELTIELELDPARLARGAVVVAGSVDVVSGTVVVEFTKARSGVLDRVDDETVLLLSDWRAEVDDAEPRASTSAVFELVTVDMG